MPNTSRVRTAASLLLTLVSIVLYGATFHDPSWWPIAWFALVPFLLVSRIATSPVLVLCGWMNAVGCAYSVADGLPSAVSNYYGQPAWIGIGFFIGMATLTTTASMVGFAFCYRSLARRSSALLPVLTAAAWVGSELLRARVASNPWADLGYSQAQVGSLVQIADITGVYGISFVLAAANTVLAEVFLSVFRGRRVSGSSVLRMALVAIAVIVSAIGYGAARIASLTHNASDRATQLAIVQANVDVGSQWSRELYGMHLDVNLRLTWQAIREHHPALVIWPENSMTFFLADEPEYQKAIARVLGPDGEQLVAGGPYVMNAGGEHFYNSAYLIAPDGQIRARYDKQQLLPFAEYFPVPQLDFLRRTFGRIREFTSGGPVPPLPTVAGLGGVVICNEVLFAELVAQRARGGAEYLVVLTNDGWLNNPTMTTVTFDMTVLRAVEQRRYVVRSSTASESAIIDPLGRVTAHAGYARQEVIAGTIEPRHTETVYLRIGDLFALLCAVAALVTWWLRRHA